MINFPLSNINNGDSGLSARTTLNEVIEFSNSGSRWLSGSFTGSLNGTASYAVTASYAMNGGGGGGTAFPYTGSAIITGSLIVTGSIISTQGFTGSLQGTASNALTASKVDLSSTSNTGVLYNNNGILGGGTNFTYISSTDSLNQGRLVSSSGQYSHAQGYNTTASGYASHAEGSGSLASGVTSHAEGIITTAIGNYSHAEGIGTIASGSGQHVSGRYNTHGDTTSLFIVGNGRSNNNRSDVFRISGSTVQVTGSLFVLDSIDSENKYLIDNSLTSLDWNNKIAYDDAGVTSFNWDRRQLFNNEGNVNVVDYNINQLIDNNAATSVDWENRQLIKSDTVVAFNWENGNISSNLQISGSVNITGSLTQGTGLTASGENSHAEGYNTVASGSYSHAEGYATIASGSYSHAEGIQTVTSGSYSHTEGYSTAAAGNYSHAEGQFSEATGNASHAEGNLTKAIGLGSHAEGTGCQAIGNYSHAEGQFTRALGNASHAEGWVTVASGGFQHVSGRYNTHGDTTSLFIIGNGSDEPSRSDIFRVTETDVQVTGSLKVTGGIYGYTPVNNTNITSSINLDTINAGEFTEVNASSSAVTITVTGSRSTGTEFSFWASNLTNDINFTSGSGYTIYSEGNKLKMNAQYSIVTVKYVTTSSVILIGSLKA